MDETLTLQQLSNNSYHLAIRSSLLAIQSTLSLQGTMLQPDRVTFTDIKSIIGSQNTTLQNTTKTLVELFSKISSFQPPPTPPTPLYAATTNSTTPAPPLTFVAAGAPFCRLPSFSNPPHLNSSALPINSCSSPSTPAIIPLGSPPSTALTALKPYSPPPTTITTTTTSLSMTTNPLSSSSPIQKLVPVSTSTMLTLTTQPINRKSFLSTPNQNSKPASNSSVTFHQTPQVPSKHVNNSPSKLISFFHTMSLMQRLKITSDSLQKSNLINEFSRLNDSSEVAKLYDEMTEKGYYRQCEFMLDRNGKNITGKVLFVFDPGGTFIVESNSDLEDKVDFEGSVMIQISHPDAPLARPRHAIHKPARYQN